MNLTPFEPQPPYRPRRFLPATVDLGNWSEIRPLFDRLDQAPAGIQTADAFQAWLLDWGELSAALDEEGSKRYIAMTCHTDDPQAEQAYLRFVETIEPETKPRQFRLSQIYLAHPCRLLLRQERFAVFDRNTALLVELFRPDNVPLETEEAKLGQQYQKLCGSLTVQFRGREETLARMGKYLEEPDRATRQEAWELVSRRRLEEKEQFESLFDRLIELREKIAGNAGFPNYLDYSFRARGRFDYTPADCRAFHQAVETEVLPLLRRTQSRRREQLGLDSLRPWDLAVDPLGRPPLKPFEKVGRLIGGTQEIFDRLHPALAADFRQMRELGLLDLANRKGKAPGGYQSTLAESRLPFIFMNADGLQRDLETMLHEAGHAFHALAAREEDFYAYRSAPIEFCEVASMTMELLGNQYLEVFHAPAEARRARRDHLEGIAGLFPWVATVDAFQHWLYSHPRHSREERRVAWLELMDRFGGEVDWAGREESRGHLWHRQLHIFLHPFYYVEYGIAQLGALQLWANSKKDLPGALDQYRAALALGGSKPLPELFHSAGCAFDFSAKTVQPLVSLLETELAALD
jgi:oligoendopeptidase F